MFIIQTEISELLAEHISDFGSYTRVSRALLTETENQATRKNSFFAPIMLRSIQLFNGPNDIC